ncbi:MAG TPA: hypothetical protein VFZ52_23130 [Chryseolinea sp.]
MLEPRLLLCTLLISGMAYGQGIPVGKVLVLHVPELKEGVTPQAFQDFLASDFLPSTDRKFPDLTFEFFKADRGAQKGKFLLVGSAENNKNTGPAKESPFIVGTGKKTLGDYTKNPQSFTEYNLIGADKITSLPNAGILGIHFIKVKQDRLKEFEVFVVEKLHPVVGHLFPDMQLLYYKATGGANIGSYITIFTIDSPAARDKYWPGGADETTILKTTFKPLEGLAKELGTYLVEGSFLEPSSGGAAAYWESKVWTDFVHSSYLR